MNVGLPFICGSHKGQRLCQITWSWSCNRYELQSLGQEPNSRVLISAESSMESSWFLYLHRLCPHKTGRNQQWWPRKGVTVKVLTSWVISGIRICLDMFQVVRGAQTSFFKRCTNWQLLSVSLCDSLRITNIKVQWTLRPSTPNLCGLHCLIPINGAQQKQWSWQHTFPPLTLWILKTPEQQQPPVEQFLTGIHSILEGFSTPGP